ncbi:amino acid adenylation domain-containing protein [Kitasatospora sp. NPDC088391]|uniref:amino acid adenylation domain-containing protein n=1 Tax=Kitasatospora sp. NPDC088391 TaxID=3364074 RepID=UPI0038230D43
MAYTVQPDPRWNPAPRPYLRADTMHGLFRWCAERWPEATALVEGERRVSYRQLDDASDDFAAALEDAGAGPGRIVPLLLPRGPELVVAMLAVLKRGAAYAALDPRWPADRTAGLVAQLDAPVLVTDLPGDWPVPELAPPALTAAGRRPTPVEVRGEDVSTVFFTSGTTGTPKGVLSPHRGTARLFDDCAFSDFGPGTAILQIAAAPWDGFTCDCWGALLCGGKVVFTDSLLLPDTLRTMIATEGVTHGFITTSLFNMIVDEGVDAFTGMRKVLVGGEKLSPPHVRRFLERHPGIPLGNGYGPVECTVFATEYEVTAADCDAPDGIPLGRPLPHTEVHVLDGDRPCAVDEEGELCLAGDGLARGYLDPELTARKFTEVEIDGRTVRVYRTGDRGRWRPDGLLRYGGRIDRQVKMRGLRIEVEEIEAQTAAVPGVADVAVQPVYGPDGACTALSGFYTSQHTPPLEPGELRAALAAALPGYMVPARLVRLERMPLTANSKLDRKALDALAADTAPGTADDPAEQAEGATERTVAEAFAAVLRRPGVPLGTPFFELGGNSLDAARLCARLGAEGHAVEAAQLYRTPTVRTLAAWIDRTGAAGDEADTGPALPPGTVELTTMQDVFLVLDDISAFAWRLDGDLDPDALRAAAGDLHHRHQALHARYRSQGRSLALLPEEPGEPEFTLLPDAAGTAPAADALRAVLQGGLSVGAGRIWRTAAVRVPAAGAWLIGVAVHHIAFDGWSQALLAEDLSTAYGARVRGERPVFDRPAATLAEANQEHRRHLARVDLDAQREFWKRELTGARALELPGAARGGAPVGPLATHRARLDAEDRARLDAAARESGSTPFAHWAAALAGVLRELSGQRDLLLGVPVARRGGPRMDTAVTSRVDLLCLRTGPGDPDGGGGDGTDAAAPTPAELGATARRALAHQELPFREVVMALAAAGLDVGPLLTLPLFVLQDSPPAELVLPGCRATPLELAEERGAQALVVEVAPLADGAAEVVVRVRTDLVPAGAGERIAEELVVAARELTRSAADRAGTGRALTGAASAV